MPTPLFVFSSMTVEPVFSALKKKALSVKLSVDLGLSWQEYALNEVGVVLNDQTVIRFDQFKKPLKHQNRCYVYDEGELLPVVIYSEETGWVRTLYPTQKAPTTLVSGILMHRIKDIDPWEDTQRKVACLGPLVGARVLDTAFGLGYTALQASQVADEVISIDIDPAAFDIAKINPWSRPLFEQPNLTLKTAPVESVIHDYPDTFTHIIHDPPTQKLTGQLYSLELYREFYRALKHKGILFHYIGDPYSAHGAAITLGVTQRLKQAGFSFVKPQPRAFGVTAYRSR